MSIEKSLAISLLFTAGFVVLPITSIFTAYRAADGTIFLSILGLGMTVLSIGIMEWFDVGHPNAALASYILPVSSSYFKVSPKVMVNINSS